MAYAPEFYIPENIIGYTGVLNKNPTVYFLSATHYGHITQVHDEWRNVGRETIRSNARYTFGNVGDNNCLVESDPGAPMSHHSQIADDPGKRRRAPPGTDPRQSWCTRSKRRFGSERAP